MDWKSVENANMATKEFKETAIETAKALGELNAQAKQQMVPLLRLRISPPLCLKPGLQVTYC